jgi:hypothetical protein
MAAQTPEETATRRLSWIRRPRPHCRHLLTLHDAQSQTREVLQRSGQVGSDPQDAGRTWPQLGTDEYPWYRKSQVFSPEKFGDWNELMPRIGERLAAFALR